MSAIERYLRNNARYAVRLRRKRLSNVPNQHIAIVACMDARVDLMAALGLKSGDAHVIRNAGGIATDDVIRSLMISQRLLATREIMLIQHTDCGLLNLAEDELGKTIKEETGVRPSFALGAFSDLEDNVRRSIARIVASPFIPYKDAVRGFVFDVKTGRVREVT